MQWYEVSFGREELDQGEGIRFVGEFAACVKQAGSARGFLLFRPRNDDLISAKYFLPPSAKVLCSELLSQFNATAVPKPDPADVVLVVGRRNEAELVLGAPPFAYSARH